jgi:hypothetical protein
MSELVVWSLQLGSPCFSAYRDIGAIESSAVISVGLYMSAKFEIIVLYQRV